jgi:uncharacterized membrane protein
MRKAEIASIVIVLLSFAVAALLYPQMPARMASHWNAQGQVDGYISKLWGLFMEPLILAGLALLFFAIPRIDPLKTNIEKFRDYYDGFIILFFLFMLAMYAQTVLWNQGIEISPNVFFPIGFGLLLFYLGFLVEKAKRNFFIGIRTPWTLSSDSVWEKTHKIGGVLFKAAGSISLLGALVPKYAVFFVLGPVLIAAAYTTVYSYFAYEKEQSA